MARTASNKTKSTRASKNATQKHRKGCVGLATALVTGALAMHLYVSLCKTPMHTSKLTGLAWVKELLAGHPRRFYNMMGMAKHVFWRLLRELQIYGGLHDPRYVTSEEQLAIFLQVCRTGATQWDMQELFQCSPNTISVFVFLLSLHVPLPMNYA